MHVETSGNNSGNDIIFVSREQTDIIQIKNITFYYIRFLSSDVNLKAMGRFRLQLLLEDNAWSTRYKIQKTSQYSDSSTDWTMVIFNFTIENYGIKLFYDQIVTPHADMCLSNITITLSVYYKNI